MSRRGKPTAEEIVKLLKRKEEEFNRHINEYDLEATELYLQTNIKSAYNPRDSKDVQGKLDIKAVGAGMIGFMQDQDVSILHTKPFGHVIAFGDTDAAERLASQTIEPWVNIAVWLGAVGKVWDKGCQDGETIGRIWYKVLPAPQRHQGPEFQELVDKWNEAEGEEENDTAKEKVDAYLANPANFPIVWMRCAPNSTWPEYDERPGVAETVEKKKMGRAAVEAKMGKFPEEIKDEKEIEVIEYANDVYVATVIKGGQKWHHLGSHDDFFLYEPWEHGLGVNPYVLIEFWPVPDNGDGRVWRSATLHQEKLVPAIDEVLTDMRTNFHKSTISPYAITIDPELRDQWDRSDKNIDIKANENIKLYGPSEKVVQFPTPQVNPDMLRFVSLGMNFMDIGMMGREAQAGQTMSGQSAVSQEQARQVANGRLAIPHEALQDGFAQVCERFLRAVVALNKKFPKVLDKITIREKVSRNRGREISVTPGDVKDFFHSVVGEIKLNIAINEGANVTNAKMATDPQHPLLSDDSARVRYFDHEDPKGEGDKIFDQKFVEMGIETLFQELQVRLRGGVEAMPDKQIASLLERARGLGGLEGQVLEESLGGEGGGQMEQINRTGALKSRAGRGQQLSQLGG